MSVFYLEEHKDLVQKYSDIDEKMKQQADYKRALVMELMAKYSTNFNGPKGMHVDWWAHFEWWK